MHDDTTTVAYRTVGIAVIEAIKPRAVGAVTSDLEKQAVQYRGAQGHESDCFLALITAFMVFRGGVSLRIVTSSSFNMLSYSHVVLSHILPSAVFVVYSSYTRRCSVTSCPSVFPAVSRSGLPGGRSTQITLWLHLPVNKLDCSTSYKTPRRLYVATVSLNSMGYFELGDG